MASIETTLPTHYMLPRGEAGILRVMGEEEAIVWLWAQPSLLPWPRQIARLFSPVAGKDRWPGDVRGVDSKGELIILENKRGPRADPFEDFVGYSSKRGELSPVDVRRKWSSHYPAELRFPGTFIERGSGTDGILPHSSKRGPIRRWPQLASDIDVRISSQSYKEQVEDFLARRERSGSPPPHYCGLIVAIDAREPRLSEKGRRLLAALTCKVDGGTDRVHLFSPRARLVKGHASRRVKISVESMPLDRR